MRPIPIEQDTRTPLWYPASAAAVLFAAGILAYPLAGLSPPVVMAGAVAALALHVLFLGRQIAGQVTAALVLFGAGMTAAGIEARDAQPFVPPPELTGSSVAVRGTVRTTPRLTGNSTRFELALESLDTGDGPRRVEGVVAVRLYSVRLFTGEGTPVAVRGSFKRRWRPDISAASPPAWYLAASSPANVRVRSDDGLPLLAGMRRRIANIMDTLSFGGNAGLLKAMTIGDRSGVPYETRGRFIRAGLAHILAVSGLHVGIVALSTSFLLGLFGVARRWRAVVLLPVIFVYAGICGFNPPVTRAALMLAVTYAAILFHRRSVAENSLFVALLAILAREPSALHSPSLHLSFLTVWGIIVFHPPARSFIAGRMRTNRAAGYLLDIVLVSTIASCMTAPVALYHFHSVPLLGIAANIPGILLATAAVTGGFGSTALAMAGGLFEPFAQAGAWLTGHALEGLVVLSAGVSRLSFAALEIHAVTLPLVAAVYAWLYVVSRSRGRPRSIKTAVYAPLVVLLAAAWSPVAADIRGGNDGWSAIFFDVGQGDAALLESTTGFTMLVDTGPDGFSGDPPLVAALGHAGVSTLDAVLVSHLHDDHVGALDDLLSSVDVRRLVCRTDIADSIGRAFGVETLGIAAGDSLAFGGGGLLVLHPGGSISPGTDENSRSLLVRCVLDDTPILLCGDLPPEAQRESMAWNGRLRSAVLKVPHHGGGMECRFTSLVDPALAVISCGLDNRYGHPAAETLSCLEGNGIAVWRTDLHGHLRLTPAMLARIGRDLSFPSR